MTVDPSAGGAQSPAGNGRIAAAAVEIASGYASDGAAVELGAIVVDDVVHDADVGAHAADDAADGLAARFKLTAR